MYIMTKKSLEQTHIRVYFKMIKKLFIKWFRIMVKY